MHVSANFLLNSAVQGENVFKLKLGKMLNEDLFPVDYDWLILLAWDLVVKCYWLSACDMHVIGMFYACGRMGQIARLFPINSIGIGVLNKTSEGYWLLMRFNVSYVGGNVDIGRDVQIRTNYFVVRLQRLDLR